MNYFRCWNMDGDDISAANFSGNRDIEFFFLLGQRWEAFPNIDEFPIGIVS